MISSVSRHLGMLRQFGASERVALVAGLLADRVQALCANPREAKRVIDEATSRGGVATRAGGSTRIRMTHADWGSCDVALRRGTSDFAVFRQCLLQDGYGNFVRLARRVLAGRSVRFVIDGGANIGLASLVFARAFPGAAIWAFEPDRGNYDACCENQRLNHLDSVTTNRRALWGSPADLSVERGVFRDGRAWSTRVVSGSGPRAADRVGGVDLASLLRESGRQEIDVVKLDVEGAEEEIFSPDANPRAWLDKTRLLAVEVHREEFLDTILPLLSAAGFLAFSDGELTVAVRRGAVPDASLLEHFLLNRAPRSPGSASDD